MKLFTAAESDMLIRHEEYPSISIFLPTHVPGGDVREDSIRLKNLLNDCQMRLQQDFPHKKKFELLRGGFDLLGADAFWREQSRGLGLFLSSSFSENFYLPQTPEEGCHIGHHFHLLPVLNALKDNRYFTLVLSQKKIKLLQFNGNQADEIPLPGLPKTIDEFLQYDVSEEHVQAHTMPLGKSVGTDAQFHGQGNIADGARWKKNVERYVKQIVKHVDKQLYGQHAPLVLAGVEFQQALFREYSGYRYLIDEGISSQFGQFEINELRQRTKGIVQPYFEKDARDGIAKYLNQINTPLTSDTLEEILPAAYTGRVDTLLVDPRKPVRGTFEPQTQQVAVHDEDEMGSEDLLNLAAVYALKNDAVVYPVNSEEVCRGRSLAAVYRY